MILNYLPEFYLFFVACILGTIAGSFLSMLIPRLHNDEKGIIKGRSHCFSCNNKLSALELVPLISYLLLRGKCRHCKKQIPAWYPALELTSALTFGALTYYSSDLTMWITHALMFSVLIFILFYDLRYKEIHDAVMFPGIILAFIVSLFLGDVISSLIGGAIGFGFFALQYYVSRGKWIGAGDMRIGAFMGLLLGWKLVLIAIVSGYIFGSIISIILLASGKADRKTAIPLGPFLVFGTLTAYFFGEKLLEAYLNLAI